MRRTATPSSRNRIHVRSSHWELERPLPCPPLLSLSLLARGQVVPTGPAPGDVFNTGAQCTITWDADKTGAWKSLGIELMTGDNFNMVHLTSESPPLTSL